MHVTLNLGLTLIYFQGGMPTSMIRTLDYTLLVIFAWGSAQVYIIEEHQMQLQE